MNNALKHNKTNLADILLQFGKNGNEIEEIEHQWQNIHLLKWTETTDTERFWYEVLAFKDAAGTNSFEKLIINYSTF